MPSNRLSKKTQNFLQSLIFFLSTTAIVICLIIYLWIYTEIDESILALEIQNSTAEEIQNEIYELNSQVESLNRADVIAKKAKNELDMVFTQPETLRIILGYIDN
tara:strand:+ start:521 stop:835 length:315 start_codon:yes stop_codon:yes gene_type:complete